MTLWELSLKKGEVATLQLGHNVIDAYACVKLGARKWQQDASAVFEVGAARIVARRFRVYAARRLGTAGRARAGGGDGRAAPCCGAAAAWRRVRRRAGAARDAVPAVE